MTEQTAEILPPPTPWDALPEGDYAIVEIMGHSKLVGRIAEVDRFGTKMLAIEPLLEGQLLPVVLQGGGSIYRLAQCSRQVAWQAQHRATNLWTLPDSVRAAIPPAMLPPPAAERGEHYYGGAGADDDQDGDEDEDEDRDSA